MCGKPQAQPDSPTVINLNNAAPADHPLRAIRSRVDSELKNLSPLFDDLYAEYDAPCIPPEQPLKAGVVSCPAQCAPRWSLLGPSVRRSALRCECVAMVHSAFPCNFQLR